MQTAARPTPASPASVTLSARAKNLHSSPIREILAVIDRPGMVSFAGGLPAPETFPPVQLDKMPATWLQYGPSEGEPALRERLALELQKLGLDCAAAQVLILSGSQQGIDMVGKLFVDAGTRVALESPTYLAALQVFRFYGASPVTLNPENPAACLSNSRQRPRLSYVIPTFQNPTGRCWSTAQRKAMAAAADESGVPVFEDDPYRDLVYGACERRPICADMRRAPWIYQGSFSKNFAPGIRLGYMAASLELLPYLIRLKQAADLHSSRTSQWLALAQLEDPNRDHRLHQLIQIYRAKRDAFEQSLQRHFADLAGWQPPVGGLFFWLRLKAPLDTSALLAAAIERGVAFMPGEPFFATAADQYPAIRLNFSHASAANAERGLASLAALVRERSG